MKMAFLNKMKNKKETKEVFQNKKLKLIQSYLNLPKITPKNYKKLGYQYHYIIDGKNKFTKTYIENETEYEQTFNDEGIYEGEMS